MTFDGMTVPAVVVWSVPAGRTISPLSARPAAPSGRGEPIRLHRIRSLRHDAPRRAGAGLRELSHEFGMALPPGAGSPVLKAGRAFVRDEFDASEEAARLGILFVSAMSEAPHPDIRPGAQR